MTGFLWFVCILSLLGLILGWLLVARLAVVIDTDARLYLLQWQGVASARMVADGHVRLWVLGWTRTINPWQRETRPASAVPAKKAKSRRTGPRPSFRTLRRKGLAVLRSFRVHEFYVNLDTDNYLTNAYLYPVMGVLSGPNRRFRINFNGDLTVRLRMENRLYRIVLALLK
ncbi:hypothetical protein [Tellurirhabdus rosea]|uniref:hypothetical protein n=1 Tax=Tellurirhabdus rosea TaxID=2674997 RepID=UPI002256BD6D|nr:hypothetical protein [Tellurirhabdus rosea]